MPRIASTSGMICCISPRSPSSRIPRPASRLVRIFAISCAIRSRLIVASESALATMARFVTGSISNASCTARRTPRSSRSGSSANRPRPRRLPESAAPARSPWPSNGSTRSPVVDVQRDGVDREVAAAQVAFERVAELDLRLARAGLVLLGAVGRDLDDVVAEDAADRPELLADGEDVVGAGLPQQALDLGAGGHRS